jgi:hypothetical protein
MASRACCGGVRLGDPAVRAAAARIDWPALVALVRAAPRSQCTAQNPRAANAGVVEILLSGDQAEPLLTWLEAQPNPADGGRPYCDALGAFRAASEAGARALLGTDLRWTRTQAASALFANHSLLVRLGAGAQPGQVRPSRQTAPAARLGARSSGVLPTDARVAPAPQAPHIDVVYNGAQFLTALSADCRPTMVYRGAADLAAIEGGRHRGALERAKAPLLLPRAALEADMAPAHPQPLQVGDMLGLTGPVVHGAPSTDDGEWRVVAFMSCSLPGLRGYNQDEQLLPWVYCQERGDVDAFCAAVLEWQNLLPWEHYPMRRKGEKGVFIREEMEKLCAGQPHAIPDCF